MRPDLATPVPGSGIGNTTRPRRPLDRVRSRRRALVRHALIVMAVSPTAMTGTAVTHLRLAHPALPVASVRIDRAERAIRTEF